MSEQAAVRQFVLLPGGRLRTEQERSTPEVREFFASLGSPGETRDLGAQAAGAQLRVLDSLGPDGAALIEATPAAALALRRLHPGVHVVPLSYYTPAVARRQVGARPAAAMAAPGAAVTLRVVSAGGGRQVARAFVVAFVDFSTKSGDQGVTDAKGEVQFALGGPHTTLDRLYVYPVDAHWSLVAAGFTATDGATVQLQPLDLAFVDGLRHYYGNAADGVGGGVTVAVVDTGVAKHRDLVVAGGANTVPGESPTDYGDNGQHHGTHVAGIIAARGTPPKGLRGVSPGVTLRAYRVFAKVSGSATNFAIAKAIDQAVTDKCDLINMSLGGGQPDPVITAAVDAARAGGSVCIIAAGNNDRGPVAFPASDPTAVAVSALGRVGTFPTTSTEADDVASPYGADHADFIAEFSNVGPEVDLTAPGVGIMSTVPGGYAEISGTSMACPAVTGMAARALTSSPALKMPRDASRSDAMRKVILGSAHSLGFGPTFEGHGLL